MPIPKTIFAFPHHHARMLACWFGVFFVLLAAATLTQNSVHQARLSQNLRDAVVGRDARRVMAALQDGADPNTRFGSRVSAPTLPALLGGFLPLPRAGALAERQQRTVLMEAIVFGDSLSATVLLHAGADPRARDTQGQTVGQYARQAGNPEVTLIVGQALLDGGDKPAHQ